MFSSISKATPQTQRSTGFIASRAMTIIPITPFTITVNGVAPPNPNSVSVSAGAIVSASIITPDDWLWHQFYHYEIDGVPSSFAVVNKSNYTISVKPEDAIKRWYMYEPATHTGTYKSVGGTNYPINFGTNYELIPANFHIVLNPLDNGVYFFDINGVQVSKVNLPADPLDYVKIPDRQSVVVLVRGGEAYEIYLNNTTFGIAPFYARLNYSEFTDNAFVFQLPGEDLITYLRRARVKTAIPPATCITYDGMFLFAGGNGSVWVVDPYADFSLVNEFEIDEFVMNITTLPNNSGVVFVTQSQKVYKMDYAGNFTELYQGTALWQPALFNGKVYIPEGQGGLLKVYNPATNSFEADILLDDFSPSYITVDSGKMYVAGHDSERVLVFDSALNITEKTFPDKVTLVSALNGTLVASHWMKSFKVLNLGDLRRIVAVEFLKRQGPVSHIGTSAVIVKTLGNDEVYARTPDGAWLWINGQRAYTEDVRGSLLADGDIISINRACRVAGLQRTNCIIGDVVYDYDVEAVAQTYFPRHIDLPIQPPGEFGIHTRTITLPRAFTPCLMSIEYGVVKVNGAYYYGDTNVTAGDIVSIEMETANNSILPVFTVGARQFVVPVSTNPTYTPLVYAQTNTAPATSITEEIIFTEFESLFDYIVPGYYTATIKKNNVDITGNYFQQFGVGDKLSVIYTTSPKLYDVTDIYILGPVNYKFTAQNTLGNPLNFLDYGNLQYPYTRLLDPYALSTSSSFLSSWYGNVVQYSTPMIQYITGNLTIAGLTIPSAGYQVFDVTSTTLYQGIESTPDNRSFTSNSDVPSDTPIIVFNRGTIFTITPDGWRNYFRSATSNSKINLFNVYRLMFYAYQSIIQPPEESLKVEYSTDGFTWILMVAFPPGTPYNQWTRKMFIVPIGAKLQSGVYIRLSQIARAASPPSGDFDIWAFTSIVAESLDGVFANISITGGDSYFVLDGEIQSSTTLSVTNGDKLALARNIVSYFDSNVTIVQHLPTGDDDGTADVVIGHWGLVNRDIDSITGPEPQGSTTTNDGSVGIFDVNKNIKVIDSAAELSRPTQRTVHSIKEKLELEQVASGLANNTELDTAFLVNVPASKENVDYIHILSTPRSDIKLTMPNSIDQNSMSSDYYQPRISKIKASTESKDIGSQRRINAPTIKFDKYLYRVEPGYKQQFNASKEIKELGYTASFFETGQIDIPASTVRLQGTGTQFKIQSYAERLTYNFRLALTYLNVRDLPKFLVFIDLVGKNNKIDEPVMAGPAISVRNEDNVEIIPASTVDRPSEEILPDTKAATVEIQTDKNIFQNKTYTATVDEGNKFLSNMSLASSSGAPIFMTDYLLVGRTEINNWVDKDTSWQTNAFFINPVAGMSADNNEVQYYLIDDIIASKSGIEFFDGVTGQTQKSDNSYTEIDPSLPNTELPGGTTARSEFTKLEFLRSSYDLIEMVPDPLDANNYIEVDMTPLVAHASDTKAEQVFIKIDVNDTLAHLPIDRYSNGLPAMVKPIAEKYTIGAGSNVELDSEKLTTPFVPVKLTYEKFQLTERKFDPFTWTKDPLLHLIFVKPTAEIEPSILPLFLKPIYQKDNTQRGGTVKATPSRDALEYKIQSGMSIQVSSQTSEIYIKPQWGPDDYGIDPIVVYRLEHEQQKIISPLVKTVMERNRPEFYFTAITLPEIDRGIVWDHDVSVEYGAFATENDAYLAASSYTSFRPQLILDTNLWTYRVLLETGLVCPLPSGRYAIAWLIRGG